MSRELLYSGPLDCEETTYNRQDFESELNSLGATIALEDGRPFETLSDERVNVCIRNRENLPGIKELLKKKGLGPKRCQLYVLSKSRK